MGSSHMLNRAAKPMRVMVVDDNVNCANSLTWVMEAKGCDVWTFFDGVAAVKAAASFHPELILCDIGMPGIDGLETCRRIRALNDPVRPLIIAQTGWGDANMRQMTQEAGFDLHLTKPIDFNRLFAYLGWQDVPAGGADVRLERDYPADLPNSGLWVTA